MAAVTAVALGVLVMHHLPMMAGHPADSASSAVVSSAAVSSGPVAAEAPMGAGHPSGGHGLLHLCLGVLAGTAVVLGALALLGVVPPGGTARSSRTGPSAASRSPPRPVSARLVELGVLRL